MNEDRDWLINFHLSVGTEVIVIVTPDGLLDLNCVEVLRKKYGEHFQILAPSNVPTLEQMNGVKISTAVETDSSERSYQALRRFMGLPIWPQILFISNIETLSEDQALCLRSCLSEQEFDNESEKPTDWARTIGFMLKKGVSLNRDLSKFVRAVIKVD
jgi:hypothetical protein